MIATCTNFIVPTLESRIEELKVNTGDDVEYTQVHDMMKQLKQMDYEQMLWYMNKNLDKKLIIERALLVNYYENHFDQDETEDIKPVTYHTRVATSLNKVLGRYHDPEADQKKRLRESIEQAVKEKVQEREQVSLIIHSNSIDLVRF
jgi:hypothetical protein